MSRPRPKKTVSQNASPAQGGPPAAIRPQREKRFEVLVAILLLVFGLYQSILYFGHTVVPNGDFPDLFKIGKDLLSFRLPASFKQAPVLGLLQNFLYPFAWGPSRELTAGWLLNAILHPLNIILLWRVCRRLIGRAAAWAALLAAINPWTIYLMTEPINETTYLFFILLTFLLLFRRSRWAYLSAAIATMVRYEAAMLIAAAFVIDQIFAVSRRQRAAALGYAVLAAIPLAVWTLLTIVNWGTESSHYLSVFFSKEYAKSFTEPVAGRTGIGLHLGLLWQVGFYPLLAPWSQNSAETIFKLSQTAAAAGFAAGCVHAIVKRRWEILALMFFFVPYFVAHAFYPYPLQRFHSTIFWIAVLVCWFGFAGISRLFGGKLGMPRIFAIILQAAATIAAIVWLILLLPILPKIAPMSPHSASVPYVAMAAAGMIFAASVYVQGRKWLPAGLAVLAAVCLFIASNQLMLVRLMGDGQREIEFRQLGEWFAANAKPDEKMAVYNDGPARLYAGENGQNVIGYPKAETPEELVAKLREMGVVYAVWATREGHSRGQHTGYQTFNLNKNIAFLAEPRDAGPYQFVTRVGNDRGWVHIFRLRNPDAPK